MILRAEIPEPAGLGLRKHQRRRPAPAVARLARSRRPRPAGRRGRYFNPLSPCPGLIGTHLERADRLDFEIKLVSQPPRRPAPPDRTPRTRRPGGRVRAVAGLASGCRGPCDGRGRRRPGSEEMWPRRNGSELPNSDPPRIPEFRVRACHAPRFSRLRARVTGPEG